MCGPKSWDLKMTIHQVDTLLNDLTAVKSFDTGAWQKFFALQCAHSKLKCNLRVPTCGNNDKYWGKEYFHQFHPFLLKYIN